MNLRQCVLTKFKYDTGNFNNIIEFWKNEIGVIIHPLSEHTDMWVINETCINKMKQMDCIPCDCRIFAHSYSQISDKGYSIILQKDTKGIDIMVPEDCYYLSLSELNNQEIKGTELRTCLDDNQGYWVTKINSDKYVGISSKGIIELTLNQWFKFYEDLVLNHLKKLSENNKTHLCSKNILGSILNIKIKQNGIDINLFKFGLCGEIEKIAHYNNKIDNGSHYESLSN